MSLLIAAAAAVTLLASEEMTPATAPVGGKLPRDSSREDRKPVDVGTESACAVAVMAAAVVAAAVVSGEEADAAPSADNAAWEMTDTAETDAAENAAAEIGAELSTIELLKAGGAETCATAADEATVCNVVAAATGFMAEAGSSPYGLELEPGHRATHLHDPFGLTTPVPVAIPPTDPIAARAGQGLVRALRLGEMRQKRA